MLTPFSPIIQKIKGAIKCSDDHSISIIYIKNNVIV